MDRGTANINKKKLINVFSYLILGYEVIPYFEFYLMLIPNGFIWINCFNLPPKFGTIVPTGIQLIFDVGCLSSKDVLISLIP